MKEDAVWLTSGGRRVPTDIGTLTWRDREYNPLPSRRAQGYVEWNVAPDNERGPPIVYGESVSINLWSDHQYTFYCCIIPCLEEGDRWGLEMSGQILVPTDTNPITIVLSSNGFGGLRTTLSPYDKHYE